MNPIYSRQDVRKAVARALIANPTFGQEAAMQAVAELLALPIEAVRDACGLVQA